MGILNKLLDNFLDFINNIILKIGKKLEDIILILRNIILKIFNKLRIKKLILSKERLQKNIKVFLVFIIFFIIFICYFIFNKNYYHTYLFYPNKKLTLLLAEKRQIIKEYDKKSKVRNIVEELLLGPIDPEYYNIFPLESKLLSVSLSDNVLLLNFNKETIMNIENESENDKIIYSLFLKSIANSICFQMKDIKLIKIYFDGKAYKYLGSYGPIDKGIKSDWNVLK